MQHVPLPCFSVDDYLNGELKSDVRHEYVAGQVFAMGGASRRHNRIAGNFFFALRRLVGGGPCQAYMSDVKVRVKTANAFYYPDVMVGCDPGDDESPYYLTSPCLIVEVLSPSTEPIDRREKLAAYRTLPGMREYVLVAQDEKKVEVYRHGEGDEWVVEIYEAGESLRLQCVEGEIGMSDIYDGI